MTSQQASSTPLPEEVWIAAFADVYQQIGPCFHRSETRQRAQSYLPGLLSPVERKNGRQLAEEAGESTPYVMQYLLGRAAWESDGLRDQCRFGQHVGTCESPNIGFTRMDERVQRGSLADSVIKALVSRSRRSS